MELLFSQDSAIGLEEVLGVTLGGSRARRFKGVRNLTASCASGSRMPWPRGPIRALTEKYSKVQLRLLSGLTGELDVAAVSGQSDDKRNLRRFSFQILTCWITEDCRESPSMRFNFTAESC